MERSIFSVDLLYLKIKYTDHFKVAFFNLLRIINIYLYLSFLKVDQVQQEKTALEAQRANDEKVTPEIGELYLISNKVSLI